jgi:uncharacterized membrane protein (UPF0136 family)
MNRGSVGAVVGVAFGCAWGIAGATALPNPWSVWGVRLSIGISAALAAALVMLPARRKIGTFRGQVYGVAVALEAAGIVITVWSLRHLSLQQFLLPAIGFVVGVHFIGLWKATDMSLFRWVAGALCTICVVAAFSPGLTENGGIDVRRVVAGLGCALVLWAAGLVTLI